MRIGPTLAIIAIAALGAACNPAIGDGCSTSGDCSVDGSRLCDTTQPGGYCTIFGCDPDTCPGGSVCVEWRFDPRRTAETSCKAICGNSCREEYACVKPAQIPEEGLVPDFLFDDDGDGTFDNPELDMPVARVTDTELAAQDVRICAALRD